MVPLLRACWCCCCPWPCRLLAVAVAVAVAWGPYSPARVSWRLISPT